MADGAVVQVDGGAGVGLLDEDGGRVTGVGESGTAVTPAVRVGVGLLWERDGGEGGKGREGEGEGEGEGERERERVVGRCLYTVTYIHSY